MCYNYVYTCLYVIHYISSLLKLENHLSARFLSRKGYRLVLVSDDVEWSAVGVVIASLDSDVSAAARFI